MQLIIFQAAVNAYQFVLHILIWLGKSCRYFSCKPLEYKVIMLSWFVSISHTTSHCLRLCIDFAIDSILNTHILSKHLYAFVYHRRKKSGCMFANQCNGIVDHLIKIIDQLIANANIENRHRDAYITTKKLIVAICWLLDSHLRHHK